MNSEIIQQTIKIVNKYYEVTNINFCFNGNDFIGFNFKKHKKIKKNIFDYLLFRQRNLKIEVDYNFLLNEIRTFLKFNFPNVDVFFSNNLFKFKIINPDTLKIKNSIHLF